MTARDTARTARLHLRAAPEAVARWQAQAARERLSLSDWLRRLADRECGLLGRCSRCGRRHDGECG